MISRIAHERLRRLHAAAPCRRLHGNSRYVIFSDLHMGDGGRMDDFSRNASLFPAALREFYLKKGFSLVLNGDIEELQRFPQGRIRPQQQDIFQLLSLFLSRGALVRLVGNHDMSPGPIAAEIPAAEEALCLKWDSGDILIVHGHQAALYGSMINRLFGFGLRYIASPLGIRNYSVAFNSRRKYRYEKRVYEYARQAGILAIMGHTHRPLFESLSRLDTLKMRIETACRTYARHEDPGLAKKVREMKAEYEQLAHNKRKYAGRGMLYHRGPLVPCLFNSGSGIAPGGITAVEIAGGKISLVLWFHRDRNPRYMEVEGRPATAAGGGDVWRVVLKTDNLDYMFTRIRLLS